MQGMNNIKNTKRSFFRPALSFHFSRLSESQNCSIAQGMQQSHAECHLQGAQSRALEWKHFRI